MSEASEQVSLQVLLADYAQATTEGKVSIIGAGVATLGFDFRQGGTSRFSLYVATQVPTALCPVELTLEVALYSNGELVQLPGPAGEAQHIRIGQVLAVEVPNNPLMSIPQRNHTGSRHQAVFDFANGLPLTPGGNFEWRVRVDGDEDRQIVYPFAVAGPPPDPVLG